MKDTDHFSSEFPFTSAVSGSVCSTVGCAAHDQEFGRGQNIRLGWSDPTFGRVHTPKDSVGSLQPSGGNIHFLRNVFCPHP